MITLYYRQGQDAAIRHALADNIPTASCPYDRAHQRNAWLRGFQQEIDDMIDVVSNADHH
jgi:ribosome modulation factor